MPRAAQTTASSNGDTTQNQSQTLTEGEVEARINAFIAGAQDPSTLTECPPCLRLFVIGLLEDKSLLKHVFLKLPLFFNTALGLILRLTDVSAPGLRARLEENEHKCPHKETGHRYRPVGCSTDALETLLDALYLLVTYALQRGPNPVHARGGPANKKHFCKRKDIWPQAPGVLFPGGVERTLDALVFWACVPMSQMPLLLLVDYLVIVRPFVVGKLLMGVRRERFAWALLQALTAGPAVPWPVGRSAPLAPRPGLAASRGLRGTERMVEPVLFILGELWTGLTSLRDELARLFAGLEAEFRGALEGLQNNVLLRDLVYEYRNPIANYLCILTDHTCVRCVLPGPYKPMYVHSYLERCATGYRCSRPGCSVHELGSLEVVEDGPTRFARCGECKVMRYCSSACQRAHWTDADPPHRDVCRVVCALKELLVDLSADYGQPFKEALEQLQPRDYELLYRAATLCPFMPYYKHLE